MAYDTRMEQFSAAGAPEYTFTLYRDKVYINEYEPQIYIDELAAEMATALYPLELKINAQTGERFIRNADAVKQRWREKKKQLELSHEGPQIVQYFAGMDQVTENQDGIQDALFNNDIMAALLTHPVHINYGPQRETDRSILMPLGHYNEPVLFKGRQWIEPGVNDYGGIFVCFAGKAGGYTDDKGSRIAEVLDLKVEYNLDAEDFTIRDIEATVSRLETEGRSQVMVDMTAYCRQEKEQEYREQQAAFKVDIGQVEQAARRGFFGNWFKSKK